MGCNNRIAVYGQVASEPHCHYKFKRAKELVDRGKAEFINSRSIRVIVKPQIAPSSTLLGNSGQGKNYERCAIEPKRQIVQGGLVRTEVRPAPTSRFQGAKVGHQ